MFAGPSITFLAAIDPTSGATAALVARPPPAGIYGGFFSDQSDGASQLAADSNYVYYATFGGDCLPGNVVRFAR
ncbi:MAG TPA: hypothetical protein VGH87_18115 [Polyangiaceae bacterium]